MNNTIGSEKNYEFEECFVAFLDVLGIKDLLKDIGYNGDLISKIIETIKVNSKIIDANTKQTSEYGDLDIRSFYFSDSFAFIMKKEPENLPHLFLIIRYLQDRFWEKGFCFRGAVTLGKMYFPKKSENVLIGQGLVDAYKLESEIAIYPRIMVSDKLVKYIRNEKISGDPFLEKKEGRLLTEGIKKDKDGVYFLDLLNKKIVRKVGEEIKQNGSLFSIIGLDAREDNRPMILQKVEDVVRKNLNNRKAKEKIKQKYGWLKSYLAETRKVINNDG